MKYNIEKAASELMIEPDELVEILEFFFSESCDALLECEKAISSSDFEALKKLFHSLKGSSSNFRMESLQGMAADLEAGAKSADLAAVSGLLPEFRRELLSIEEQIKQRR